jgi:virulence-associated protein VapD
MVLDKCQNQDERSKNEEEYEEEDNDLCHCCFEADKGTLYLCDNQMKNCNHQFCEQCITQNFGSEELQRILDSPNWVCFLCDQKQLSRLHEVYEKLSQASYFNQVIEECKARDLESETGLSTSSNSKPVIDSSNEENFSEREIVASHILKLLDDHIKQNHESAQQMEQPFVDELRARIRDELRLVTSGP